MNAAIKLGISVLIYVVFHGISKWLVKFLPAVFRKLFKKGGESAQQAFVNIFAKPLSLLIRALGIFLAVTNLPLNIALSAAVYGFASKLLRVIIILLISTAAQNFVISIPELFDFTEEKLGGINKTLIRFFTKIGKALIIVFTLVIVIEEFGYNVTGIITGLGLGGLTFSLAAQDIASNFMAGVTILIDKPFEVGNWIAVGGLEGIVEEMDFRTTRIRTFDNALITVPNSKISGDSVTNWTKMNYRKTNIIIGLVYSTTKDTLKKVCDEIYAELSNMEEIKTDSLLVKFDNFNASSLDVKISYNSYPIPAPDHLALKEKVNYAIMNIVENNNTDFAFNTFTIVNE
ncbi:MAG: mechanosensitive ion channel family protein [Oscillospiraceae bacterium]|nr:mechanosensitive ion channel family protein [Oscillospiraceae bacterium]